ncbi:MAG: hypothetical protein WAM11_09795 [Cyanobium sp.]
MVAQDNQAALAMPPILIRVSPLEKTMNNKVTDLSVDFVMVDGAEDPDIVGCWEMHWWAAKFDDHPVGKVIDGAGIRYAFGEEAEVDSSKLPSIFTVAPAISPIVMSSGMGYLADYGLGDAACTSVGRHRNKGDRAIQGWRNAQLRPSAGTSKDLKFFENTIPKDNPLLVIGRLLSESHQY